MQASVLKLILSLSLYLPPKKEQAMEITRVQAIKINQERERERKSFLFFHHLFSYSALSLSCLLLAKHSISLSLSLSPLLQGGGRYLQRKREQERRNTLDRPEVPPTIVSLTSQLGTQPGSLHCLRPCDNASEKCTRWYLI
jgi:hypothetical protein